MTGLLHKDSYGARVSDLGRYLHVNNSTKMYNLKKCISAEKIPKEKYFYNPLKMIAIARIFNTKILYTNNNLKSFEMMYT